MLEEIFSQGLRKKLHMLVMVNNKSRCLNVQALVNNNSLNYKTQFTLFDRHCLKCIGYDYLEKTAVDLIMLVLKYLLQNSKDHVRYSKQIIQISIIATGKVFLEQNPSSLCVIVKSLLSFMIFFQQKVILYSKQNSFNRNLNLYHKRLNTWLRRGLKSSKVFQQHGRFI